MAAAESPKKRMKKTMRIGTHSGSFHCDEALACFMLQNHVTQFKGGEIVRSRDAEVWKTCDILVDVGAKYEPENQLYDHHQKEFTDTLNMGPFSKTKLSSAGLVYKHFGKEVIRDILIEDNLDDKALDMFYLKIYQGFIEEVDGIDNGVNQYEGEAAYETSTGLSSRVGRLNPQWNENADDIDKRFAAAMELTGKELVERVVNLARSWWPARSIVQSAVDKRFEIHKSGGIIFLEQFCPWKRHLNEIEEEQGLGDQIKYAVYGGRDGSFRIQCVPLQPGLFDNRKDIPWKGLRDEKLDDASGIKNCIFVHSSGFTGGNRTKEGAMEMAVKAIEL